MKVVLAYSGGLDTSTILLLLRKMYNAEVITVTVDVGQEEELEGVEERAYKLGAVKHYTIDAKKEFAEKYIAPAIKANGLYEDAYPLGTALARPLIAAKVAEIAIKEGADAVAHGCTSKGNDQVRFELTLKALLPEDIEIIAPVRKHMLTRKQSIELLRKYGYDVPSTHSKYSIDENLWTRSIEGGVIDDPAAEPPEDAFAWTVDPSKAPDTPLSLEIGFEKGVPVSINGEKMDLVKLIETLNRLVGFHGYGRIDHIENRVVGLKSREVYEAPAALTLIAAHRDLEKMVLTPRELRFKRLADTVWTDLVYSGLWVEPLRIHLQKFIDSVNEYVTGTVKLKVYKGSLTITGRWSPYSSYSKEVIDYNEGWYPSDEEARGFITLHGLHSLASIKARGLSNLL
ncbi:MAG: argininosuccinate synthase [Crenarchaeota archaeon]|nr:argininosuccinate synthase [Thermoproteota archaeon]